MERGERLMANPSGSGESRFSALIADYVASAARSVRAGKPIVAAYPLMIAGAAAMAVVSTSLCAVIALGDSPGSGVDGLLIAAIAGHASFAWWFVFDMVVYWRRYRRTMRYAFVRHVDSLASIRDHARGAERSPELALRLRDVEDLNLEIGGLLKRLGA